MRFTIGFGLIVLVAAAGKGLSQNSTGASPWMFVWAGDANQQHDDFLAIFDVRPQGPPLWPASNNVAYR
jgi:hypothetical protein